MATLEAIAAYTMKRLLIGIEFAVLANDDAVLKWHRLAWLDFKTDSQDVIFGAN